MLWNKTYGGTDYDDASALVQTVDGGFALAGYMDSIAEDWNFYLVKVGSAEEGLSWVGSSPTTITIHRGTVDLYCNYMRVRILKAKEWQSPLSLSSLSN